MRYDRGDYRGTWGGYGHRMDRGYGGDYRVFRGGGYGNDFRGYGGDFRGYGRRIGYGDEYASRGGYANEQGYDWSSYERDYLGRPRPDADRQLYTGREHPGYGRGGQGGGYGMRGYDGGYGPRPSGGGAQWRGAARHDAGYGGDYRRERPRGLAGWVRQAFTGRPPRAY